MINKLLIIMIGVFMILGLVLMSANYNTMNELEILKTQGLNPMSIADLAKATNYWWFTASLLCVCLGMSLLRMIRTHHDEESL